MRGFGICRDCFAEPVIGPAQPDLFGRNDVTTDRYTD